MQRISTLFMLLLIFSCNKTELLSFLNIDDLANEYIIPTIDLDLRKYVINSNYISVTNDEELIAPEATKFKIIGDNRQVVINNFGQSYEEGRDNIFNLKQNPTRQDNMKSFLSIGLNQVIETNCEDPYRFGISTIHPNYIPSYSSVVVSNTKKSGNIKNKINRLIPKNTSEKGIFFHESILNKLQFSDTTIKLGDNNLGVEIYFPHLTDYTKFKFKNDDTEYFSKDYITNTIKLEILYVQPSYTNNNTDYKINPETLSIFPSGTIAKNFSPTSIANKRWLFPSTEGFIKLNIFINNNPLEEIKYVDNTVQTRKYIKFLLKTSKSTGSIEEWVFQESLLTWSKKNSYNMGMSQTLEKTDVSKLYDIWYFGKAAQECEACNAEYFPILQGNYDLDQFSVKLYDQNDSLIRFGDYDIDNNSIILHGFTNTQQLKIKLFDPSCSNILLGVSNLFTPCSSTNQITIDFLGSFPPEHLYTNIDIQNTACKNINFNIPLDGFIYFKSDTCENQWELLSILKDGQLSTRKLQIDKPYYFLFYSPLLQTLNNPQGIINISEILDKPLKLCCFLPSEDRCDDCPSYSCPLYANIDNTTNQYTLSIQGDLSLECPDYCNKLLNWL